MKAIKAIFQSIIELTLCLNVLTGIVKTELENIQEEQKHDHKLNSITREAELAKAKEEAKLS